MITVLMKKTVALILALSALLGVAACTSSTAAPGRLRVVASLYPLAWAARQIAPAALVTDLTPKGGEPHDLQLTARQRLAIDDASVVLIMGEGFQPEVERAAKDSNRRVVELLDGISVLPSTESELRADPHIWLDPKLMRDVVLKIAATFADVDDRDREVYLKRGNELGRSLEALDRDYRQTLSMCELKTIVTTHEAFGYLAQEYGLTQLGLTGLTPESEPTARAIGHARDLARAGTIAAIFYESSDEGARIGRSVAGDVGVSALPLSTLESQPSDGDYRTQMSANLAQLKKGMRCR